MKARLNRLFAADGRCFDVAVDHGFFGEASFLAGIEDMEGTIATLVEAAPDAIQLSPGQAPLLQSRAGRKPALVLRTDVLLTCCSFSMEFYFVMFCFRCCISFC